MTWVGKLVVARSEESDTSFFSFHAKIALFVCAPQIAPAHAMRLALESGYHGARSGRIAMRRYASASSPFEGVISTIPGE